MPAVGKYDGGLEMFVEPPRTPDRCHLLFYRWLSARGRLEHLCMGPPSGECCTVMTSETKEPPT